MGSKLSIDPQLRGYAILERDYMDNIEKIIKDLKRKGINTSKEDLIASITRDRQVRTETVKLYVKVIKVLQPELDKIFKRYV